MADYWEQFQEDEAQAHGGRAPSAVRFAYDDDEWQGFPVAAIFETYREAYELSVEDVSKALKIRIDYLEALERGDYDRLPGRTFAIGYVRSISNFLQLPSELMIERFKAEAYDLIERPLNQFSLPEPQKDSRLSRGLVMLVMLLMLAASWGAWALFTNGPSLIPIAFGRNAGASGDPGSAPALLGAGPEDTAAGLGIEFPAEPMLLPPSTIAVVGTTFEYDDALTSDATREAIFGVPFPKVRPAIENRIVEVESDQPGLPRVMVRANSLAWIHVRSDRNETLVASMLQRGEEILVPEKLGMTLFTASPRVLDVFVNGRQVSLPSEFLDAGTFARLSLDPTDLLANGQAL